MFITRFPARVGFLRLNVHKYTNGNTTADRLGQ
jgi:hypothetical protein